MIKNNHQQIIIVKLKVIRLNKHLKINNNSKHHNNMRKKKLQHNNHLLPLPEVVYKSFMIKNKKKIFKLNNKNSIYNNSYNNNSNNNNNNKN